LEINTPNPIIIPHIIQNGSAYNGQVILVEIMKWNDDLLK